MSNSNTTPEQAPTPAALEAGAAQTPAPRRGVQAVTGETFSFSEAVGGVRGAVEALLPGTLFVVVYVVTTELDWALWSAVGAALVSVAARLVQRTPVTQALGGLLGIGVGVFWAWRSGEAGNFFAWGLWTNAIYLVVVLISVLVRWPAVGLFVEGLRAGFSPDSVREQSAADSGARQADGEGNPLAALVAWRADRRLVRVYTIATWLWVGMFSLRLAVQLPLYLDDSIGWLGTARLVLGVPLWGLVLWLTWTVVRGAHPAEPVPHAQPDEADGTA